jgi:hypothetical protein
MQAVARTGRATGDAQPDHCLASSGGIPRPPVPIAATVFGAAYAT